MFKLIFYELILMCSYVAIISGTILFVFGIQNYKGWIDISYISDYITIIIGLIFSINGYLIYNFYQKKLQIKKYNERENYSNHPGKGK